MVKRFTFLLTDQTVWKLLFKTVLATLALSLLLWLDFSPVVITISFFVFLGIYFSLTAERKIFRVSFLLLPVLTGIGSAFLPSSLMSVALLLLFALLFFTLLGLIGFFFKDRFLVYGIFNTALLLLLFTLIFYVGRSDLFWVVGMALFLIIMLLFKEVFLFLDIYHRKRALVVGLAMGIVAVEVSWVVSFLPLGFINAAVFMTLFSLLIRDSLTVHFQGFLNLSFVFRQLVFFVFLTLITFAASRWSV